MKKISQQETYKYIKDATANISKARNKAVGHTQLPLSLDYESSEKLGIFMECNPNISRSEAIRRLMKLGYANWFDTIRASVYPTIGDEKDAEEKARD